MKFGWVISWRGSGLLLAMVAIVALPYIITRVTTADTQRAAA